MHGFAGQLDLRKLSGLRKVPGWRIVAITMLIGCLNLAGFPLITSGFWSKDMIMAEAFVTPGYTFLGLILVLTAGLTAYYTFRVYFRVFEGPVSYEPGDELHGHGDDAHGHDHGHGGARDPHVSDRDISHKATPHAPHVASEAALAARAGGGHHEHGHGAHDFHPHAPGWAINTVLATLAVLSFLAIPLVTLGEHHGWVGGLVHGSTAHVEAAHGAHGADAEHHAGFFGDPHRWMLLASTVVGLIGIAVAYFLHLAGRTEAARSRADDLLPALGPIPRWAQNKWYVDELYHFLFVLPLRVISHISALIDRLIVDGLVNGFGLAPRGTAYAFRRSQTGVLHDYALRMVGGVGVILFIALVVLL
jgi:NADH-quinone oxidoreductase subunit L